MRFAAAPGLSRPEFYRLAARWRKQGRECTYCGAPAELADHVIPLSRGGTNYEGNLTPCCVPCNSSKNDSFVSYWKHKKTLKAARLPVPELPEPAPPRYKSKKLPVLTRCPSCRCEWIPNRRRHCETCTAEINAMRSRNLYRIKVGLTPWFGPRRKHRVRDRSLVD